MAWRQSKAFLVLGGGDDIGREAGEMSLLLHHNCLSIKPHKWEGDKRIETSSRKKGWLQVFEDTVSECALAHMYGYFWGRGIAERGHDDCLGVPSPHMVEKVPQSLPGVHGKEKKAKRQKSCHGAAMFRTRVTPWQR